MYNKSIFAGIAIGLGCWLFLTIENPICAALLFSCGLLAVRLYKLNLFTGKTQYLWNNSISIKNYLLILLGNLVGISIVVLISGLIGTEKVSAIAQAKSSQSLLIACSKGIGCGMLMSLATYEKTPLWVTVLAVATFILAGFNHCIADFYYMIAGANISINLLLTILGNIIGGIIFSAQKLTNT